MWVNSRECDTAVGTFSTRGTDRPREGGTEGGRERLGHRSGVMSCARASELGGDGFARCGACARVSRASCSLIFFMYRRFVRSRFVHSRWTTGVDCRELRGAARRATAFVLDAVTATATAATTTAMTRGFSDEDDDEF